jgi:hypothetical protein
MPEIIAREAESYWSVERELLATIAEIAHALLLVTAKAYGGKGLPEPLHIPRPGERRSDPDTQVTGENVISFSEFATFLRGN